MGDRLVRRGRLRRSPPTARSRPRDRRRDCVGRRTNPRRRGHAPRRPRGRHQGVDPVRCRSIVPVRSLGSDHRRDLRGGAVRDAARASRRIRRDRGPRAGCVVSRHRVSQWRPRGRRARLGRCRVRPPDLRFARGATDAGAGPRALGELGVAGSGRAARSVRAPRRHGHVRPRRQRPGPHSRAGTRRGGCAAPGKVLALRALQGRRPRRPPHSPRGRRARGVRAPPRRSAPGRSCRAC